MYQKIKNSIANIKAINLGLLLGLFVIYFLLREVRFYFVPDYFGIAGVLAAKRDVLNLVATILASIFGFFLAFVILGFQILHARLGSHVSVFLDSNPLIKRQVTLLTFALLIIVIEYLTEITWNLSVIYYILYLTIAILLTIGQVAFTLYEKMVSDEYLQKMAEAIQEFAIDKNFNAPPSFDKLVEICKIQIKNGNKKSAKIIIEKTGEAFWNQIVDEIFEKTERKTHYQNTVDRFEFMASFFWKPLVEECKQYKDYETINEIVLMHYRYLNRSIEMNLHNMVLSNLVDQLNDLNREIFNAGFYTSADQQLQYIQSLFRTIYSSREIMELDIPALVANPGFDKVTVYSLHAELANIVSNLADTFNRHKDFSASISIIDKYERFAAVNYRETVTKDIYWRLAYLICNEAISMRENTILYMNQQEAKDSLQFSGRLDIDTDLQNPKLFDHIRVVIEYNEFLAERGLLSGAFNSAMQALYILGVETFQKINTDKSFIEIGMMVVDAMVRIKKKSITEELHMAILECLYKYIDVLKQGTAAHAAGLILDIKLAINKCGRETYKQYWIYKETNRLKFEMYKPERQVPGTSNS